MTRLVLMLGLLGFCGAGALAQPQPESGLMRGAVHDESGAPVGGASVELRRRVDEGPFGFWGGQTVTDSRGLWAVPGAEEGPYFLSVTAPGFAPLAFRVVDWRLSAPEVTVRLTRLRQARFRLLDGAGAPVARAHVHLSFEPEGSVAPLTFQARSDHSGIVTVEGVTSGRYAVRARWDQWQAHLASWSSEMLGPASALLDLRGERGGVLRWKIEDQRSRPIGGAALSLVPSRQDSAAPVWPAPGRDRALFAARGDEAARASDATGIIELEGLPPGDYSATLALPGGVLVPVEEVVRIDGGQRRERVTRVAIDEGARLRLRLVSSAGRRLESERFEVRPLLLEADPASPPPSGPLATTRSEVWPLRADADGALELYPLRPGRYRIVASPRRELGDTQEPTSASIELTIPRAGLEALLFLP